MEWSSRYFLAVLGAAGLAVVPAFYLSLFLGGVVFWGSNLGPPGGVCIFGPMLVVGAGLLAARIVYQWERIAIRKAATHCPECDYDMRGNPERGCPECGWNSWESAYRIERHRCTACGHDLRGETAKSCPECGWNREPKIPQDEEARTGEETR